jgi:hypothetical protein
MQPRKRMDREVVFVGEQSVQIWSGVGWSVPSALIVQEKLGRP